MREKKAVQRKNICKEKRNSKWKKAQQEKKKTTTLGTMSPSLLVLKMGKLRLDKQADMSKFRVRCGHAQGLPALKLGPRRELWGRWTYAGIWVLSRSSG